MLISLIDSILAEFVHQRIPFSHRDVAARISGPASYPLDEIQQMVFERMARVPAYRLSLAHFVGEGLTLMCIPCQVAPGAPVQIEMPAMESGHLVK